MRVANQERREASVPIKNDLNKRAIRKAIKGLPCRLNYGRLFGVTRDEEGNKVESTCAVGYLFKLAGAQRTSYYGSARNTQPFSQDYGDKLQQEDLIRLKEMFGFSQSHISSFVQLNDSIKGQGYKAAHQRCVNFKEQLTKLLPR